MNKITVEMHADCIELCSGQFRIAVTTACGPRVIGGFIGDSQNIFRVMPNEPMASVDTGFRLYGGHRLWQAPEVAPRTYAPDNEPVSITERECGVEFTSPVEALSGLQKSILIEALGNESFRLTHRLTNHNLWTIETAPWALSVMAPGGVAVIPQLRDLNANPFEADRTLVMWPYSSFADPRLTIGNQYILLKQDSNATSPCKIGFNAESGWMAYVNQGTALVKSFEHYINAEYPDNGCSVESYSCADFCEIETLAPLYDIDPGETVEHVEFWKGLSGIASIENEADIARHLAPRL